MKKIIASIIAIILVITTASCFAESRLSEYEEKLNGTWEKVECVLYSNYYSDDAKYNYYFITTFEYPSTKNTSDISTVDVLNADPYTTYLFEGADGKVYLTILSLDSSGKKNVFCSGEITFSEDGNYLLLFPTFAETGFIMYQKK